MIIGDKEGFLRISQLYSSLEILFQISKEVASKLFFLRIDLSSIRKITFELADYPSFEVVNDLAKRISALKAGDERLYCEKRFSSFDQVCIVQDPAFDSLRP